MYSKRGDLILGEEPFHSAPLTTYFQPSLQPLPSPVLPSLLDPPSVVFLSHFPVTITAHDTFELEGISKKKKGNGSIYSGCCLFLEA